MPGEQTPYPLTDAEQAEFTAALSAAVNSGAMRINTARKILGLKPLDIPEADTLLDIARLTHSERLAAMTLATAPAAFDAYRAAWTQACAAAWDADLGEPAAVLPDFLWPRLTELVNPVTGAPVTIQRVKAFPVTAPAARADAG